MGNMKYQYRSRSFWCKGYYVDTVGKNTKKINIYIIILQFGKIKKYISSPFHQRFINDVYNIFESSYKRLLFKK